MQHAHLLNEIFRFKHKRPSDCQDALMCVALVKWLTAFVQKVEAGAANDDDCRDGQCGRLEPLADDRVLSAAVFSRHEVQVLTKVAQCLVTKRKRPKRGDVWFDPWLPEYGCVVQRSKLNSTRVEMEVVFADGWERTLHFLPSGECVHSAMSTTHHSLHCADLDMNLEAKFSATFNSTLRQAQTLKGSERRAAKNELGHQKNPQFIAAVVKRAAHALIKSELSQDTVDKNAIPGGGTTDVGLHTGGRARDTCWPVVQAAIARNLCGEPGLFRKIMLAIKMNTLEDVVSDIERDLGHMSVKDGCGWVDDLFYMLEVIVQSTVELLKGGYDVSLLEKKCSALRAKIDGFLDDLNRRTAEKYVMPKSTELKEVSKLGCRISMPSPKRSHDLSSLEITEQRQRRALQNMDGCSFWMANCAR
ncbi:hypothetical protein PsorP6_010206 [Peronosclerospora sorghi]|uniref:Uncharacterized protein n=1 Tax=Peronosclerospora sorghi TaxID=230839 RepID=A0ACC0VV65_9STRA|nr:hypothetical protein PsorP6_010206 [Peronosclerospora sorghi]